MTYKVWLYTSDHLMPQRGTGFMWRRATVEIKDNSIVMVTHPLFGSSKQSTLKFSNITSFLYGESNINFQHTDTKLSKIVVVRGHDTYKLVLALQEAGLHPYKPINSGTRLKDYAIWLLLLVAIVLVFVMESVNKK